MIERKDLTERVETALRRSRAVVLLGSRQCEKTTLARLVARGKGAEYFDLEDPIDQERLSNPRLALEQLTGLVVIDEIQRRPELFPLLRVLLDRAPSPAKFLLLGSASPDLIKGSSESLAGRIEFVDMGGFDLTEIGVENWRDLWVRGGVSALLSGGFRWRQRGVAPRFYPHIFRTGPAGAGG